MLKHKRLFFILIISLCVSAAAPSYPAFAGEPAEGAEEAEEPIRVFINGGELFDTGAYFLSGRLMVPAGAAARALGARMVWNPETGEVCFYLFGRYVWMQTGNPFYYHGDYAVDSSGAAVLTGASKARVGSRPEIRNRAAYVPAAVLTEALGGYAVWLEAARIAMLVSPPPAEEPKLGSNGDKISAENIPAPPGQFRLLTSGEAAGKYNADEPFVLFVFDSRKDIETLAGLLKASAEIKFTFYGLDVSSNDLKDVPFIEGEHGEKPFMCFISGYGKTPEFLYDLAPQKIYESLLGYWAL